MELWQWMMNAQTMKARAMVLIELFLSGSNVQVADQPQKERSSPPLMIIYDKHWIFFFCSSFGPWPAPLVGGEEPHSSLTWVGAIPQEPSAGNIHPDVFHRRSFARHGH
jgi:hypothetical protein